MKWIHTLTNHFTDELRVTGGKDKHSKADRRGRLQKAPSLFPQAGQGGLHWAKHGEEEERFCSLYSIFVVLFCQGEILCHSHRLL